MTINTQHWTAGVHHDGSGEYVSSPCPSLGEEVTIYLRTPVHAGIQSIWLRLEPDGEPYTVQMGIHSQTATTTRWAATFRAITYFNRYRFKILTDEGAFHYGASGIGRAELPNAYDFKLLAGYQSPEWVRQSMFYQIFPDSFNKSVTDEPESTLPVETIPSYQVYGRYMAIRTQQEVVRFHGGDLRGLIEKLDYLKRLGITSLYLNPIFKSSTPHRFDVEDFYQVDPYLGGNHMLQILREETKKRDIHLILDVTLNHISRKNVWFEAAMEDRERMEAKYFAFQEGDPGYAHWFGSAYYPSLNYSNPETRDQMYGGDDSVMLHWLKPPYSIDGWRIDAANMVGRQGAVQLGHEIMKELRTAVKKEFPEAFLLGEFFYDGTDYSQGDQVDGVMNYQGFNFVIRRWLSHLDSAGEYRPKDSDHEQLSTEDVAAQMQIYLMEVPYVIALQHINQLSSHDTVRFLSAVNGDRALTKLAITLLMTYVGIPCIFQGDEIGMEGRLDGEAHRNPIPWKEAKRWRGNDILTHYKTLIAYRQKSPALQQGSLQLLKADDDLLIYQRQLESQRCIVLAYRGDEPRTDVVIPVWHSGIADGARLVDVLSKKVFIVKDGALTIPKLAHGQSMILEERAVRKGKK